MAKTITYRGPAAGAFIRAQRGEQLTNDKDRLERIATLIYGQVSTGTKSGMDVATHILGMLASHGAEQTAATLVGESTGAVQIQVKKAKR